MIRMNKLTDYGVVLLTTFAREPAQGISARELSTRTGIPQPTVVKLLKTLLKAGLLVSQRGTKGGYALAKLPEEVPVSAVIEALEGPLAITECSMPGRVRARAPLRGPAELGRGERRHPRRRSRS